MWSPCWGRRGGAYLCLGLHGWLELHLALSLDLDLSCLALWLYLDLGSLGLNLDLSLALSHLCLSWDLHLNCLALRLLGYGGQQHLFHWSVGRLQQPLHPCSAHSDLSLSWVRLIQDRPPLQYGHAGFKRSARQHTDDLSTGLTCGS